MSPTPAASRREGPDGKIRFEWHEGQAMVNHHLKVVTEAAKRHIAVNPHEPVKDTGPSPHLSELGRARGPARHGI